MFKQAEAFSSFSVPDIQLAKDFYGNILGLDVKEEMDGYILHLTGIGNVFLYAKDDHTPARFTVLNFPVDDIDQAVRDLKTKHIAMEHYEGEIKTDPEGIHRGKKQGNGPDIAWFKDPFGNILSVVCNG